MKDKEVTLWTLVLLINYQDITMLMHGCDIIMLTTKSSLL